MTISARSTQKIRFLKLRNNQLTLNKVYKSKGLSAKGGRIKNH